MLLSISQLQEDRHYEQKFLVSNIDSNSEADFEYINNSITKTMKNVNRCDGLVVRASASQSVDLGFIP